MAKTIATPSDVTTAIAAAATRAAENIAAVLTGADSAAVATIAKHYGADIDGTALKLAARIAGNLAGTVEKIKGQTQVNANAAIRALANVAPADLTDTVIVAAARAALDADKARKATASESERAKAKELTKAITDKTLSPAERHAAIDEQIAYESDKETAKLDKARETFARAVLAAMKNGLSATELAEIVTTAENGI